VNGTATGVTRDSFTGKTVTLNGDLDLGQKSWTPIGANTITISGSDASVTTDSAFAGTFDGGGHTISGLSVKSAAGGVALFGCSTGTLKNFTVSGTAAGNFYTAGVAARGSGTISDVTSEVAVTAAGNCVGGILGDAIGNLTITGCHNTGAISNGGVSSEKSTGRIAGIAGCIDSSYTATVSACSNSGDVTGYQYVSGIVGGCFGSVSVDACCNTGAITGVSFGKVYLGGIAGKLAGGTISNCYNTGALTDSHWSAGHIRAVGGIAGCEEDHTEGTAITNCYTTGAITLNTSNMIAGTNYIYETGNISGGNNTTESNTMRYENCFYLAGRIAAADPANASYPFWSDVYKDNPLAYDTAYITSVTAGQLSGADTAAVNVLSALGGSFAADTKGINGGDPILYWQASGSAPAVAHTVTASVSGGTASVACTPTSAVKDTEITVSVTGLESGKQIHSLTVTDASGAAVPAAEKSSGVYTFSMPARNVSVAVVLESQPAQSAARHAVTLPQNLDAIWSVSCDSTYLENGTVPAGATVYLSVAKKSGAETTSLNGVSVSDAGGGVECTTLASRKSASGSGISGQYSFIMPDADVSVGLNISYRELNVCTQTGSTGTPTVVKSYSRTQMEAMAVSEQLYSGWSSETTGFLGRAQTAVTLAALLKDAGVTFAAGDSLKVTAADGMSLTYPYQYLLGTERWYYPGLFTGSTDGKTASAPMLTIRANTLLATDSGTVAGLTCDTLNAYRFVFGQSADEFTNHTKIVDTQPKCVCALTVIKTASGGTGGTGGSSSTAGSVSTSTTWDGKSLDTSWYTPGKSSYTIATAAQLAGLAALVNGIYNRDITTVYDPGGYIKDHIAVGASGTNNQSTTTYHYGVDLKGATVCLDQDLDMSDGNYMPVGGQYLMDDENTDTKISASFNGTFDGQGHSVTIQCDRHCDGNYGDGESVGLIGRLGCHDSDAKSLWADQPTVRNVVVYGSVHANRSVGGVVGKCGKSTGGCRIECCANFASVSGTDSKGTGGIVGAGWNSSTISDCFNAGKVSSSYATGAVAGISGSNEARIVNCYNVGAVSGVSSTAAIASSNGGDTYENCYYLTGSADTGVYGKTTAAAVKTAAEMKTDTFLALINGNHAFAADTGKINGGYPILAFMAQGTSGAAAGGAGGAGGAAAVETYGKLTVSAGAGGKVTLSTQSPQAGSLVTATVRADAGYDVESVTAKDKAGTAVALKKNGDGTYSFTMPSSETTLTAVFKICRSAKFSDVDVGKWYHAAIDSAVENGWFGGVSETKFAPNGAMTRAALTAVLWRFAGKPKASSSPQFRDVPSGAWYGEAVSWAVGKGIVTGYADGTFRPGAQVTRQQMVAFLYRYAQSAGSVSAAGSLSGYADASSVAPYARASMAWAVGAGVMQGTSATTLSPGTEVTRAQAAAILTRYAQL
jgi:hypothetical protein